MQSYLDLLRYVRDAGVPHQDRTGVGTVSVFGAQWRHDMRTGFPLLTTKRIPLRWVFEELRWFLSGSSSVAALQKEGVDIWDEWATEEQCAKFGREAGDLGPVYGPMMRAFPCGWSDADKQHYMEEERISDPATRTTDQIAELLNDVKTNPNSRRLIVTHWHPYYQKWVTLPPCHTLWQVKVYEATQELSLHLFCRSIDTFLGLPFDIASYALLLHMLCAVLRLTPRELVISISDLHIYNTHQEAVEIQLARSPRELPQLEIIRSNTTYDTPLDELLNMRWKNIKLTDYVPHSSIKAPVAI